MKQHFEVIERWRCSITQCFLLLAILMLQGLRVESFFVSKTRPLVQIAADPSRKREASRQAFRSAIIFSSSSPEKEKHSAVVSPRNRQIRRKPTDRRPKYYWLDPANLRRELVEFWIQQAGVNLVNPKKPPIPNEVLLIYFQRHDLRAAITKNGGRNAVSKKLGGLPIVAGRWQDAVEQSPEMAQLVQLKYRHPDLTADSPPCVCTARTTPVSQLQSNGSSISNNERRWAHRDGRKPKGYWSIQRLLQELYEYVGTYRSQHKRPAVWMPRPSEFAHNGRNDLRDALQRFGGSKKIGRLAGMVSYREWFYFEGQLELLLELKRYLDEQYDDDSDDAAATTTNTTGGGGRGDKKYSKFPTAQQVKRHGYEQLYSLIQYYGGRKFLAARLGMEVNSCSDEYLSWGEFDLEFAIKLLLFVRKEQLRRNPPMSNPVISMPSKVRLLSSGKEGIWLDEQILKYGGYENVARRLGLAFFPPRIFS